VTGPTPVPTQPFRLDAVEHWVRTPAPTFGQHTDEVLRDLLGLTDDQLARLHDEGTIADRPVGV
jgi:crotonobetainyl-CoA:carnitine CoA-transferase CaiB-like acyl-CoA transferase